MTFVRRSLQRHVSQLANESCFWIWKIWLQQAGGKCGAVYCFLLADGNRGVGLPRASLLCPGKGRVLRAQEAFCYSVRVRKPGAASVRGRQPGLGPGCGLRVEFWKRLRNHNREVKKQGQEVLLWACCTKEGGGPRLLVTQEEARLGK